MVLKPNTFYYFTVEKLDGGPFLAFGAYSDIDYHFITMVLSRSYDRSFIIEGNPIDEGKEFIIIDSPYHGKVEIRRLGLGEYSALKNNGEPVFASRTWKEIETNGVGDVKI